VQETTNPPPTAAVRGDNCHKRPTTSTRC